MKKSFSSMMFVGLTLILTILGYKLLLFVNYRVDVDKFGDNIFELGDTIEVMKKELSDTPKNKYNNVLYQNLDYNLILDEDESKDDGEVTYNTYYVEGIGNDDHVGTFKIGKTRYSLFDIFSSDDIFVYGIKLKSLNRKKLLNDYNINNDYDIVTYINKHYDDTITPFSSSNKIKMNYFMKTFSNTVIPSSKVHLINGDFKGYMYVLNDNYYYEVNLLHKDENYIFSFINNKGQDYFDLDMIKEFIANIQFID